MSHSPHSIVLASLACGLLTVSGIHAEDVTIRIEADQVVGPVSRCLTGACIEDVNHEIYGGIYSQMIFGESFQEPAPAPSGQGFKEISRMWRAVRSGTATGRFAIVSQRPFAGEQSQQLSFDSGEGQWGLENQGLNRWGMNFVAGKPYEGYVWARAEKATTLFAALERRDGARVYAETPLTIGSREWQRLDFTLTPAAADKAGRFALKLKQPGSVTLGHAFLQPGPWGRFKDLPVRRDVAEALIAQGITVLRYGGSMVNNGGYRWKKMIGPRDRRPPYAGTWYRYSSNGWGILDFMDFCEAAGFQYVPAFEMGETPQDMADFVEYARGPADSAWGRRRVADGHPQPYRLRYLELGNEERVDENYFTRFRPIAEAIWAKDPQITPVVGDFFYNQTISDPMRVVGGSVPTLAAHRRILDLAKRTTGRSGSTSTSAPKPRPRRAIWPARGVSTINCGSCRPPPAARSPFSNSTPAITNSGGPSPTPWRSCGWSATGGSRSPPRRTASSPTGRTTTAGTRDCCSSIRRRSGCSHRAT